MGDWGWLGVGAVVVGGVLAVGCAVACSRGGEKQPGASQDTRVADGVEPTPLAKQGANAGSPLDAAADLLSSFVPFKSTGW